MRPTGSRQAATKRKPDAGTRLSFSISRSRPSGAQTSALDQLELETDNIRAALRWSLERGSPERVAHAGWALTPFWWLCGLFDEGMRWMTEAIDSGGLSDTGRAEALLVRGFVAFWRADYQAAIPALTEALGFFTSIGDRHRAALASLPLAASQAARGDGTVIDSLEESRALLAELGDEWELMLALNALCWALNMLEEEAALALFEEARERATAIGTSAELATAVGNLSRRRALRGEKEEAKLLLAEALAIVRALKSPTGVAYYTEMVADLAAAVGRELSLGAGRAVRQQIPAVAPKGLALSDGRELVDLTLAFRAADPLVHHSANLAKRKVLRQTSRAPSTRA